MSKAHVEETNCGNDLMHAMRMYFEFHMIWAAGLLLEDEGQKWTYLSQVRMINITLQLLYEIPLNLLLMPDSA